MVWQALSVEYVGEDGLMIVRVSEGQYYFGDGETINAIGISPLQFLRFHPYMEYVGGNGIQPTEAMTQWIQENVSERGQTNDL